MPEAAVIMKEIEITTDFMRDCELIKKYFQSHHTKYMPHAEDFLKKLRLTKEKQLSQDEKLWLAKIFIRSVNKNPNSSELGTDFLQAAVNFKNTWGADTFIKIYEVTPPIEHQDISLYIKLANVWNGETTGWVYDMYLKDRKWENLISIIQSLDTSEAIKKFQEEIKEIESLSDRFSEKSPLVQFPLPSDKVDTYIKILVDVHSKICSYEYKRLIPDEIVAKLLEISNDKNKKDDIKIHQLALLSLLILKIYDFLPNLTQLLCIIAMLDAEKGIISQIKTGEGKSLILAILTAMMALQGHRVFIITSSLDLAILGYQQFAPFFSALKITSNHIGDRHNVSRYEEQVLYCKSTELEFILQLDRFKLIKNRQIPWSDQWVAFVDEADNFFIDSALNSSRIASRSPFFTPSIFKPMLGFVESLGKDIVCTTEHLKPLKEKFCEIGGEPLEEIKCYSDTRLVQLMNQAHNALFKYTIKKEYVLEDECIKIVDHENTDEIRPGSRYTNGLHEFLEVKHGLKPRHPSDTISSMTHYNLFDHFSIIYAVTGTMGEKIERNLVKDLYNLDSFDTPPHKPSKRMEMEPLLYATNRELDDAIIKELQSMQKANRAVLCVFKTIEQTQQFSRLLAERSIEHQVWNEQQTKDKHSIIAAGGQSKVITIANNISGRGIDFILSKLCLESGGLHVLITFYPKNHRVKDQIFGRAARQGQPGSCRMLLSLEDDRIQELVGDPSERQNLLNNKDFIQILDALRSEKILTSVRQQIVAKIVDESIYRIFEKFVIIFYPILVDFENLDLNSISSYFSKLKKVPDSKHNVNFLLKFFQQHLHYLLNQQNSGVLVDWGSALNEFKSIYLDFIKKKWAYFYSRLSSKRPFLPDDLIDGDFLKTFGKAYINNCKIKFYRYLERENMLFIFENPVKGFYKTLANMLNISEELILKGVSTSDSEAYQKFVSEVIPLQTEKFRFFRFKPVTANDARIVDEDISNAEIKNIGMQKI